MTEKVRVGHVSEESRAVAPQSRMRIVSAESSGRPWPVVTSPPPPYVSHRHVFGRHLYPFARCFDLCYNWCRIWRGVPSLSTFKLSHSPPHASSGIKRCSEFERRWGSQMRQSATRTGQNAPKAQLRVGASGIPENHATSPLCAHIALLGHQDQPSSFCALSSARCDIQGEHVLAPTLAATRRRSCR
jgi:hypothetical protein